MFSRESNSDNQQLEGRSICAQDYEHGNCDCICGFSMNHHEWNQSPLHSGSAGRPHRMKPSLHIWQTGQPSESSRPLTHLCGWTSWTRTLAVPQWTTAPCVYCVNVVFIRVTFAFMTHVKCYGVTLHDVGGPKIIPLQTQRWTHHKMINHPTVNSKMIVVSLYQHQCKVIDKVGS